MARFALMGNFLGGCVVLFVLAVGFVVLTQGPQVAALIDGFRSVPLLYKIAWAVIVLVPLAMLVFAVWLSDTLVRQRKAAEALELRLDGVRQGAKDLTKSQVGIEGSVHHLTRTDPEDAIAALERRITEAERFAQFQQSRNETVDLESRIGVIREQQQLLKERLGPVLDARRAIEQRFAELDTRQHDIDRTLAEIASGDDAVALDIRVKSLIEFVRQSHVRCDQIDSASKTLGSLKEEFAELSARLAPFAAAEDGIINRVKELSAVRDKLAGSIDSLQLTPEGALADRVYKLTNGKKKLDDDIWQLNAQFSKLAALRNDVGGLFVAFDRALSMLSLARREDGAADIDACVDELSRYIEQTQAQFDEIERRVLVFEQLKTRLGELQSRLVPLESDESGVVKLIGELHDIRERLALKIRRIEGSEDGDLAARVKLFADAKSELEKHVSSLSDQFTKLATIRKDISGLFDKLSNFISASMD